MPRFSVFSQNWACQSNGRRLFTHRHVVNSWITRISRCFMKHYRYHITRQGFPLCRNIFGLGGLVQFWDGSATGSREERGGRSPRVTHKRKTEFKSQLNWTKIVVQLIIKIFSDVARPQFRCYNREKKNHCHDKTIYEQINAHLSSYLSFLGTGSSCRCSSDKGDFF